MDYYIKIKPIQVGELQEKTANAITWRVENLIRGAQSATAYCTLFLIKPDGNVQHVTMFEVALDQTTLNNWGADDTVIDEVVLAYSPLFIKDTQ